MYVDVIKSIIAFCIVFVVLIIWWVLMYIFGDKIGLFVWGIVFDCCCRNERNWITIVDYILKKLVKIQNCVQLFQCFFMKHFVVESMIRVSDSL